MPNKPSNTAHEPDAIGKPRATSESARPGTERARDEQREGGPRYGGGSWELAEERGERRYGHARNDDADPSELSRGESAIDDDTWPGDDASLQTGASTESREVAARAGAEDRGETETGGRRAGFGRGEQPRKPKARTKPNPRPRKR